MAPMPMWEPSRDPDSCLGGCCLLRDRCCIPKTLVEAPHSPEEVYKPQLKSPELKVLAPSAPELLEGSGGALTKTKWVAAFACATLLTAAVGGAPASVAWAGGSSTAVLGIVLIIASLAWATAALLSNKSSAAAKRALPDEDDDPRRGAGGKLQDGRPCVELNGDELRAEKWHQQRQLQAEAALPVLEAALQAEVLEDPEGFLDNKLNLLRYLQACNAHPTMPATAHAKAAVVRLRQTLKWRQEALLKDDVLLVRKRVDAASPRYRFVCPACRADPMVHCCFPLGLDKRQRVVIYSCIARASDMGPSSGMLLHVISQMETAFGELSTLGVQQMVLVVDFRGFGARHANPRLGIEAIKIFGAHYPERLGEVVLLGFPAAFTLFYHCCTPLLDPVTKQKIRILRTTEEREAYMRRLWPDWMRNWLAAADELPPVENTLLPPLPGGSGDPRVAMVSEAGSA